MPLKKRKRTEDVGDQNGLKFSDLLLKDSILKGLYDNNIIYPSPVQLKVIPIGRLGCDIIVQAKSGTGKTCVFTVILLETIKLNHFYPQSLVIAPTREIATQIYNVINSIGKYLEKLQCYLAIGGMQCRQKEISVMKTSHIIIGTPGRLIALLKNGSIPSNDLNMIVLDEADQLLDSTFKAQISRILSILPNKKQVLVFSATYQSNSTDNIVKYMNKPRYLLFSPDKPSLIGVSQYYINMGDCSQNNDNQNDNNEHHNKVKVVTSLLNDTPFHQCIIFANNRDLCQHLVDHLIAHGFPTAFIAGNLQQKERNKVMNLLREFKIRVLVSTDLTARGVDIERITLVINMDLPYDSQTYLHRVGRTGRFGTYGIAISLLYNKEIQKLKRFSKELQKDGSLDIKEMMMSTNNNNVNNISMMANNSVNSNNVNTSKDNVNTSKDSVNISKDNVSSNKDNVNISKHHVNISKDHVSSNKDNVNIYNNQINIDKTFDNSSQMMVNRMQKRNMNNRLNNNNNNNKDILIGSYPTRMDVLNIHTHALNAAMLFLNK